VQFVLLSELCPLTWDLAVWPQLVMQRNFRAPAGTFETRKQQGVAREDANNVMAVLELVFSSLYYSFLWGPAHVCHPRAPISSS
jgi:hypothetical protein